MLCIFVWDNGICCIFGVVDEVVSIDFVCYFFVEMVLVELKMFFVFEIDGEEMGEVFVFDVCV